MRVKFSITFVIILITLTSSAQNKDQQLARFWLKSDYRVENKLMSDASRAVYFKLALKLYPNRSINTLIDNIENIRNNYKFQDYLLLNFLLMYGRGEILRMQLADICGTYSLGNYVSNYIEKKYLNDKRYLQAISQRKKEAQNNGDDEIKPEEKIEEIYERESIPVITVQKVEFEAEFPGGDAAFRSYLVKELSKIPNPPDIKLTLRFAIMQEGVIDSVSIENPTNTQIDEKVISIFKNSPKWIPAKSKDGKLITTYRRQPITLGYPED